MEHYFLGGEMEDYEGGNVEGGNFEGGRMHRKKRVHHLMHHSKYPMHHHMMHHMQGGNVEGGYMVGGKFVKSDTKLLLDNEYYVSKDIKQKALEGKAELKNYKENLKNHASNLKKKELLDLVQLENISLPILRKVYMLIELEDHKKERNKVKREMRQKTQPPTRECKCEGEETLKKKTRKEKTPSEKKIIAAKAKATREAKKAKKNLAAVLILCFLKETLRSPRRLAFVDLE